MGRVHVLDGKGLTQAVKVVQRQLVLWYTDVPSRDADIPHPWDGCTTAYPDGAGGVAMETWLTNRWVRYTGGGTGGGGVTAHGQLTGLTTGDDHPQYLRPAEVLAGGGMIVTQN